ncbi:toll/interleukin-1 receptor domain-containing protein [Spirosoma sp. RP8]|uniref:Toll/interleukin-1 receptor domain-containing protein n=1 Tax=Spirosoma liriopis TaxID=2937440 RepID=A0ABT0HVB9_9BACT|nr:toll/interleukin-1 receptor domain-containing protein [Spirosoma liriopis]MCK8495895.1 toll/interleukin-1 receptor domain-containing protein [Spirosoma liriopis]
MEVFISHSNEDVKIAEAVVNLIRKATNISPSVIRCTSLPGYKLPVGASTEEQLRQEIETSKIFIGLITSRSVKLTFVLFELGARWATKAKLLPLICDPAGISLLEGPLKNINALKATDPSDVLQFIEEVGKYLNIIPESASSYINEVDYLKKLSSDTDQNVIDDRDPKQNVDRGNNPNKRSETHSQKADKEFDEIDAIIKSEAQKLWTDDYEMQIDHIKRHKNAYKKLQQGRPSDVSEQEFFKIRERAQAAWPLDFEMQLDQEERQIDSLRQLKGM